MEEKNQNVKDMEELLMTVSEENVEIKAKLEKYERG